MEHWDIYDIDRKFTGRTIVRGGKPQKGEYRLTVHVCVFNSKNEMLIQKRQPFKEGWSGMWDITAGGSAMAGETSQEAAMRELGEEVGINTSLIGVRPHLTVNFHNGFDDVYLIEKDVDATQLKVQYEEVEAVKWATKDEILEMIREGTFIGYYESIIHTYFDMRNGYGKFVTDSKKEERT